MDEKTLLAKLLIQAIKLGSIEGEKAIFSALRKHYVNRKSSNDPNKPKLFNPAELKAIDPYKPFTGNGSGFESSGKIQWIKMYKTLTGFSLRESLDEYKRRFEKTD